MWTRMFCLAAILLAVGCGGDGSGDPTPPALEDVRIHPASAAMPLGTTQTFSVTAVYSDGSERDVTDTVTWHMSGSGSLVEASSTANYEADAIGDVTLTASLKGEDDANWNNESRIQVLAATLVQVSVSPSSIEVPAGLTRQLEALGRYTDNSLIDITQQVSWQSSDPTLVSVSDMAGSKGQTEALIPHSSVTVSATLSGISSEDSDSSAVVNVSDAILESVRVIPGTLSLPLGLSAELSAKALYSDGATVDVTDSVSWSSSIPSVLTVDSSGLIETQAEGSVLVSVSYDGQSSDSSGNSAQITVTPVAVTGIYIDYVKAEIGAGGSSNVIVRARMSDGSSQLLGNTVVDVVTPSSDIVAVDDQDRIIGLKAGSATVDASYGEFTASDSGGEAEVTVVASRNCSQILNLDGSATTGTYSIDLDGSGPLATQPYFCEMKDSGYTYIANAYANSAGDTSEPFNLSMSGMESTGVGNSGDLSENFILSTMELDALIGGGRSGTMKIEGRRFQADPVTLIALSSPAELADTASHGYLGRAVFETVPRQTMAANMSGAGLSTMDADNDLDTTANCASVNGAAFWYRYCDKATLWTKRNGVYGPEPISGEPWYQVYLKVRHSPASAP